MPARAIGPDAGFKQKTKRSARRNHALGLKKAVLDESCAGVSIATVAMAHGLNAHLVHK